MSEITRNQAIQIVEDIRTAISAGSVTNTMEAQVLEYCVSVLGRRIVEASLSGHIENLPDVAAFLEGISPSATLKALLEGITDAVEVINANIGNGYVYAGIATPSGTPVSGKVFYLAKQAGQYANFGGLTVTEGVNILKRNGSTWTQEQLLSMADIRKNPLIGYYECDTAGDTSAKTVTAAGYVLPATGGSVKIKMANRNTVANATLNINSTGAKPLYYNGQRAGVGNTWDTNEIIEVFYDGAKYQAYNVAGSNGDGVFDISAYNLTNGQPTPYEDLEAALGPDGNHVPLSLHKGGVSIKFIQGSAYSSDNKYVRYNLLAQSFTTDVTQWAVDDCGVYVDNPEFIAVWTDSEKNIIFAIEKDGNLHFGVGIPRQVIDYIQEKIDELSLDEYEDIVTFLGNLIEGDNTLQELLDKKVDGAYVENPEFIKVCTDSEGGILFGIKNNGDVFLGYGVPTQIKEYVETALLGKVNKEEGKILISIQYIQEIENPEYIEVVKDENGNLLWAIKKDGTVYFGAGIPKQIEDFMQDYNNTHIIEKELSVDFVMPGFFTRYGSIQFSNSLPDYSISNPVKLYEGDRIKIKCWAVANDPVLMEYQDRWNTYWANTLGNANILILPNATGWGEYECVVKKTSYYVFSCNASEGTQPTIKILRTLTQQSQIDSFDIGERDSYGITDHNYVDEYDFVPNLTKKKTNAILTYSADTKKDSNFIVNAVAYPNGEIIACRAGGNVVKIANDGTETVLLTIANAQDWRGMFMDSQLNVYVSPHSSTFYPGISALDRGLYKLSYGASQFEKVISLCRSTTEIKEWTANTQYAVGDKVMRDNQSDMYICKTAHTSASSFDVTYWNPIDVWTQETSYAVADLCKYRDRYYRCIENHTSTSSFDVTKWNAATEYMSNDDTIWTMCEDEYGFVYAGVYSHSMRANPSVYRSISAFSNLFYYQHNFIMNGTLPESRYGFNAVRHVHCINFNPFDNCLYAAVGEVNTICKSSTHGGTWDDLKVACYYGQPTYILGVKDGLVIGSDGHYSCGVSKLMSDGKTMKLCGRTAPGFIFNIRRSDLTGWLYAWTRIDNIVQNIDRCPPQEAVDDIDVYNEWIANAPAATLRFWNPYHEWALKYYPEDARRPQNAVIMVSKDEGETWEVFNKVKVGTNRASICGYITVGYFREGECLAGLLKPIDNTESEKAFVEPVVISEGKKKRTSDGYDLTGEIFIKLNTNNIINY